MIHILFYGLIGYGAVTVSTAEFPDGAHCRRAAAAYRTAKAGGRLPPYAYCVPKDKK